jgi:hypothetical protein
MGNTKKWFELVILIMPLIQICSTISIPFPDISNQKFSHFSKAPSQLTEKPIIVPISCGTCSQTLFKVNHPHALL